MAMSLYVGNLSWSATESSLQSLFATYGEVLSAKIVSDRDTGRSRGFGFVEMEESDARKAIAELDGKEVDGRTLRVNEAQKKEKREKGPYRF
jgi:RNA recognition motif-containing protein